MKKISPFEIKETLYENRKMILILLVIFLLAFTIRAHLMRYEYFFGFDSYYHARIAGDLAEFGTLPANDPLAYYQEGGSPTPKMNLFWIVTAGVYRIFTLGVPFNNDLWILFVKVFPALFGALISVSMYWLGKEIYNKKAGIAMALIAATVPAFVYRTMASFFEEDSLGFLWMIVGLVFFVRGVKSEKISRESLVNAGIAGVFFALMAWTWSMYSLVFLTVVIYIYFAMVLIATKENQQALKVFIANSFTALGSFIVLTMLIGENILFVAAEYVGTLAPLDAITIVILLFITLGLATGISWFIAKQNKETKKIVSTAMVAGLYIILIVLTIFFIAVPDLQDRSTITSRVGEEQTGKQSFGTKYNSLITFVAIPLMLGDIPLPVPGLVLLLIPLLLYFSKRKDSHLSLIIFFWVIITLLMAYYKLKFTYTLGLPIAAGAGFTTYLLFKMIKKANFGKGLEAKTMVTALMFFLLLGVGSAAIFLPDKIPEPEANPDWKELINWINAETPKDAKIFNWWNMGHIFSFSTERKVSSDNRNASFAANKAMAEFVTTRSVERAYEIATEEIRADYVILDTGMFFSGPAYIYYEVGKVDNSDPRVQEYFAGSNAIATCDIPTDTVICRGNINASIAKDDFFSISETWTDVPKQFQGGVYPLYFYRRANQLTVLNKRNNESNLAKIWFHSKETEPLYEEVFSDSSIKVFKIK